jgi:hypothetical protein
MPTSNGALAQGLVNPTNVTRNAIIQTQEKRGKGLVLKREMSSLETGAVGFLGGALAGGLTNAWDVVKTQVCAYNGQHNP